MAGIIFDNTKDKREWGISINDLDKGLRIVDLLNEQDKQIRYLTDKILEYEEQRREDVNFLSTIAMSKKAEKEIFRKALNNSSHSIEYTTILKLSKELGIDWND